MPTGNSQRFTFGGCFFDGVPLLIRVFAAILYTSDSIIVIVTSGQIVVFCLFDVRLFAHKERRDYDADYRQNAVPVVEYKVHTFIPLSNVQTCFQRLTPR
jgi:hypothetical protein